MKNLILAEVNKGECFVIPNCLFLPLQTFVSAVSAKSAHFNQIWQIGCRILLTVISLTLIEICDLIDMRGLTDFPSKETNELMMN